MKNLGEQSLSVFDAGSDPDMDWQQRSEAIRLCHYVFAWGETRSDHWWADVSLAAAMRKPVAIAIRELFDGAATLMFAEPFVAVGLPRDEAEARWVSNVVMSHRCDRHLTIMNANMLADALRRCESPIEARLLVHLWQHGRDGYPVAQVKDESYRIDIEMLGLPIKGDMRLGIECDGHDFHERSKEQAQRDKKRDRDLAAKGWRILRFTGSEIWKDPSACAAEVYRVFETLVDDDMLR